MKAPLFNSMLLFAYVALMCSVVWPAPPVNAQHVCFNPSRSWYEYQTAPCTTDELHQFAYLCDVVRNLPNCNPPATLSYRPAPIPYSAPTTYGGEVKDHGVVLWRWIKAGDAARPCTAAEQAMPGYAFACNVKMGETLYYTQRFWGAGVSR